MNKLLSSTATLTLSLAGIGFFAISPAQAGCNAFGCSQSRVAECNPFGCPNSPMGEECTPFGCPPSPRLQSQSNNNSNSNNNSTSTNTTLSDFQFCVEQYRQEGRSTSYAIRECDYLR